MQAFINSQVRQLTRIPNVRMPRPSQCLIVAGLAAPSLASHAGVALKDFLVSLDGVSARDVPPQTYRARVRVHEWVFYSRPRHEMITLEATGIEPGVKLQPTPDGIRESYNPKAGNPSELEVLWEARDFKALEDLSRKVLALERDHPALAFLGAALYETGRKAEGAALVGEYLRNFAPHWTTNFTGIACSYVALDLLAKGEQDAGRDMLQTAFDYHSCPRLADLLAKHTGTRPPLETPLWLGKVFPTYSLPPLETAGSPVSLAGALEALGEKELLAVCLLASYRGNGPYNDFMSRYFNFASWFGAYLKGLHVITLENERRADRSHYFEAEDAVKAANLPLQMLLEDGSLSAQVGQTGSPFIVLLDRNRVVRCEGDVDSVAMWETVARMCPS